MNLSKIPFLKIIGLIALLALAGFLKAGDPSILTLERLFGGEEFKSESLGTALWLTKSPGYLTIEDSKQRNPGQDIILNHPKTGSRTILVPAERLVPEGHSAPLEIDDFQLSPLEDRLLIFTNSKRVWRQNTRGDYWILDLKEGKPRKLGGDAEESGLMFAKFSPDGSRIGYV
jgi:dipeptidyl-peptidase-4